MVRIRSWPVVLIRDIGGLDQGCLWSASGVYEVCIHCRVAWTEVRTALGVIRFQIPVRQDTDWSVISINGRILIRSTFVGHLLYSR